MRFRDPRWGQVLAGVLAVGSGLNLTGAEAPPAGAVPGLPPVLAVAASAVPPVTADLDLARRLNSAFVSVAETVSPAVVVIRVRMKPGSVEDLDQGGFFRFLPEEMRKEFRERVEKERKDHQLPPEEEQGSGVLFRPDGYILTNAHVVQNADTIEVRMRDGRRFPAQVKGFDHESDIAVIKVDATELPTARLGDSSKVRVGEFAIAIGAPFDLEYSVTFGHISAKGRRVATDFVMMDQDFLQTDASINPGNSGGPLVNIEGDVIGINSMIRGMNTGIGFAVPVSLAREVATQLIEKGKFTRSWLGVNIEAVGGLTPEAKADLPTKEGVRVTRVLRDGPSWGSELETNDIIVAVEGDDIRDEVDLKRRVSRRPAGKPIKLQVFRGTKKMEISVTPGELPEDRFAAMRGSRRPHPPIEPSEKPAAPDTDSGADALGFTVRELDEENAERVGLEKGQGVMVVAVQDDSPAARRRIQPGEVVTKVNRKSVRSPKEFRAALKDADLKKGVSLAIVGENGRRFEVLKVAGE